MTLPDLAEALLRGDVRALSRAITLVEAGGESAEAFLDLLPTAVPDPADIIGITGAPGAGKSSLINQLLDFYKQTSSRVGVVAIDPTSTRHGGAILGDRIRWMRHTASSNVVIRSLASRGAMGGISEATTRVVELLNIAGCRPVLVETVGVSQLGCDVASLAGVVVAVTAPGLGDDIQMMKAGVIDIADLMVLNKSDQPGAAALGSHLAAELEHRGGKMLAVNSIDGTGVAELAAEIERIRANKRRASTAPAIRARSTVDNEIVDRALALLRPHLRVKLETMDSTLPPETLARELASSCLAPSIPPALR